MGVSWGSRHVSIPNLIGGMKMLGVERGRENESMRTGYFETVCVEESDGGGGICMYGVSPPELQLSISISSIALHTLTVHPFSIGSLLNRAIFPASRKCAHKVTL